MRIVAVEVVVLSALLWLWASRGSENILAARSAGAGVGLMALINLSAFGLLEWARAKPPNTFLVTCLGSLLAKMTIIGLTLVAVVLFTDWPRGAFVAGLMVAWIAFVIPLLLLLKDLRSAVAAGSHTRAGEQADPVSDRQQAP